MGIALNFVQRDQTEERRREADRQRREREAEERMNMARTEALIGLIQKGFDPNAAMAMTGVGRPESETIAQGIYGFADTIGTEKAREADIRKRYLEVQEGYLQKAEEEANKVKQIQSGSTISADQARSLKLMMDMDARGLLNDSQKQTLQNTIAGLFGGAGDAESLRRAVTGAADGQETAPPAAPTPDAGPTISQAIDAYKWMQQLARILQGGSSANAAMTPKVGTQVAPAAPQEENALKYLLPAILDVIGGGAKSAYDYTTGLFKSQDDIYSRDLGVP